MPIDRRQIFRNAWKYAKAFAAFDHSSPRARFADALRKIWSEVKGLAAQVVARAETGPRAIAIDTAFGWRPQYTRLHARYNPW